MKRIEIKLDDESLNKLRTIVRKGERVVREVRRSNILLLAHAGKHNDEIADILGVDRDTVLNIKKRYLSGGLEKALHDGARPGQPKKYDDRMRVEVVALACSAPPEGRKRWSIRLIAEEMKKRKGFEGINREYVRMILKKTKSGHGREECGASRP